MTALPMTDTKKISWKFSNRLAAPCSGVDEEPTVLQGEFDFTRSVLIEFPSAEQAMAWMTSPEYTEIAKHRLAASIGDVIMVKKREAN